MAKSPDDAVVESLVALIAQLEQTTTDLSSAGERAHQVVADRAEGQSWRDIVIDEDCPLIVEMISRALKDLGAAGSRLRRAEALALLQEGLSVTEISNQFGVSRQRVSTLVNKPSGDHRTSSA